MHLGMDREYNSQQELKLVSGELKQLTLETVKLFLELRQKGMLSEVEYNQMVRTKLEFLSGMDDVK